MSSDEVPEGRCGFVLEPGDVPADRLRDEYKAGSDDWYADSNAVCCWREVWDGADDGRCIWHAKSEDKPADELIDARADGPERLDGAFVPAVELGDAIDFEGCGLQAATFEGTNLEKISFARVDGRYAQFRDADLYRTLFLNADLQDAQFPNTELRRARFIDSDLRDAQFSVADLRNAKFSDSDLRDAQFLDPDFHGVSFAGAYMDLGIFGQDSVDFDGTTDFGWSHLELEAEWGEAARTYRSFQQLLCEHALPEEIRRYRVRDMHARRRAARQGNDGLTEGKLVLARWTTLYGESPYRVVYTSLATIGGCALLYPFWGLGVDKTTTDPTVISYPFGAGDLAVLG